MKCGGDAVPYGDGLLCKRWQCWDEQPSDPAALAHGTPVLESELRALGVSVEEAIRKHGGVVSMAATLRFPGGDALNVLSIIMSVIADVEWHYFVAHVQPGSDLAATGRLFARIAGKHVVDCVSRSMPEHGVRPN